MPTVIPVAIPVDEPMVTLDELVLHTPPVLLLLKEIAEPRQTEELPLNSDPITFKVNVDVAIPHALVKV